MNVGNFMEQSVSYDRRSAADVEETEDVGELRAAEYLVFLFALETYVGWLEETSQAIEGDPTLRKGISLAIQAEKQIQLVQEAIRKDLSNPATQALLDAALRTPMTIRGFTVRALRLRIVLSKGGTATMKAIFGTSTKARREVQEAMEASSLSDPDAALKQLAAQPLKNQRMRAWIDLASDVVPPAAVVINAVQQAAKGATDASESILINRAQEESRPNSDASVAARDAQAKTLAQIEVQATETAKKALAQSGEEDRTLTKAEVIGVATATATAIASDPDKPQNIPPALRSLDPEQRAAAMTGGKVRVSAGAGSGKSTTLLARAQYLIDNGAVPNRMMAMSFNKKAADELATKMAVKIGSGKVSTSKNQNPAGVQVGTMHSTFLKFINQYGTPAQVNVFAKVNGKGGPVSASTVFKTVKDLWEECFPRFDKDPPGNPDPEAKTRTVPMQDLWKMPPKSNRMMSYMNYFQGQGWTAQQAREWAKTQTSMWTPPGKPVEDPSIEADQAAKFYEVYEGLKGSLGPGWRPNLCGKPSVKFQKFVDFYRAGKPRVGDFNDMLSIFRDILKTNPVARRGVQSHFDHIMIDECQDLNPLQFEIAQLMTEHIETDDPKRSFWMVGDDKQSIYGFRGSDPENFIGLDKMGFKDRQITTNYRCAPEFIDAANRLIAHNANQIPMEAKPAPNRARGESSLVVSMPKTEAEAATEFGKKILEAVRKGEPLSNFAVLARTNGELAIYTQICAVLGTPFVQKKAASVFASQETETFRAFMACAVPKDAKAVQESFCQTLISGGILRPKFSQDRAENIKLATKAMKRAMAGYCSRSRISFETFDPVDEAVRSPKFVALMLEEVGGVPAYGASKDAQDAAPLLEGISQIRGYLEDPAFKSKDLFEAILDLPVVELTPPAPGERAWTKTEQKFRDSTSKRIMARIAQEDADEDPELVDSKSTLGTLSFISMMMEPNVVDPSYDPTNPQQFYARFEGLSNRAEELRIDPDEHEREQIKAGIPLSDRTPPPGVYLGTVHSTKGAEWHDVTLLMPQGKFPISRKPREPQENEVPEEITPGSGGSMESERRLGYVGLTRAKNSLTILCPGGASSFVTEAGLKEGQNVSRPETLTPGAEPATPADADPPPEDQDNMEWTQGDIVGEAQKMAGMFPGTQTSFAYTYDRSKS